MNKSSPGHAAIVARDKSGNLPVIEPLLDEDQYAEITGESVKTVRKRRLQGTGCPYIKLGRLIRYRPADVRAYLASLPARRSTSEPKSSVAY